VAAVLSLAMCLDHLDEKEAALAVEQAAASVLPELGSMGGPDMGMSTDEIGDVIAERI
jgi:3-isopropylmalate dehydrogenase